MQSGRQAKFDPTHVPCTATCIADFQEAGTRAIEADEQQRHADAVKLYQKALEIISEGLSLQVPTSGLSAKIDNVANWKEQLDSWQSSIQER